MQTEYVVEVAEEIQLRDINKGSKLHRSLSNICEIWAPWVQGQCVGVLVATYICITYHGTNVVSHMLAMWAGEGGTLDPETFCFSGLTWHLASSWLNWQLLWSTKWPCVIPLLGSKPSPDSWLVNSTCEPVAKQDVCCQSRSSHVETPGKVIQPEEARSSEEDEESGGRGKHQAFYMHLFCIGNDYLQGK